MSKTITGGNIMKTNLEFMLGFVYGLVAYYAVGFFGALGIAAAGYLIGNLIIRYFNKKGKK